ncbi:MAG: Gfo/Idh/MocA family oxidoreductase [bacterium]|nr:Gfo/Idh/MocA family oxidoreductase [bacterium]
MDRRIKVAIYGVGPIGIKTAQYITERNCFDIIAAIDIDPQKIGKKLSDFTGIRDSNVIIQKAEDVLGKKKIDVVVLTTVSSLKKAKPQIIEILKYGINIVSTCEELSYPWLTQPEIAEEIDETAKKNNVSVLGTGVNPGFLMDLLPLIFTAVCQNVEKIKVERLQDASKRRIPFQKKVGVGLTIEEFSEKVKAGTLRHVGLTESIHMIAHRMGWNIEKTEDIIEPVVADREININGVLIEKGKVLGVKQTGKGFSKGVELITLIFVAAAGIEEPYDRVSIKGTPDIESTIKGGVNGDIATSAIVINAIPVVVKAKPGLRTMADIEPVTFFRE